MPRRTNQEAFLNSYLSHSPLLYQTSKPSEVPTPLKLSAPLVFTTLHSNHDLSPIHVRLGNRGCHWHACVCSGCSCAHQDQHLFPGLVKAKPPAFCRFVCTNSVSAPTDPLWNNRNYCPRDPGCKTYTMSVHDVNVHANGMDHVEAYNLKAGTSVTVEVTGITTMKSVSDHGSYRICKSCPRFGVAAAPPVRTCVRSHSRLTMTLWHHTQMACLATTLRLACLPTS